MSPFDERERAVIDYCVEYAKNPVGLPGHILMIIIAKLWELYISEQAPMEK